MNFFEFCKFTFSLFLNSLKFANLHYRYFNFGDCFDLLRKSRNDKFKQKICQIPQILSKITKNKRENDEKDYRTAKFAKKRS